MAPARGIFTQSVHTTSHLLPHMTCTVSTGTSVNETKQPKEKLALPIRHLRKMNTNPLK